MTSPDSSGWYLHKIRERSSSLNDCSRKPPRTIPEVADQDSLSNKKFKPSSVLVVILFLHGLSVEHGTFQFGSQKV